MLFKNRKKNIYMYGYLCNYINMHTYNLLYVCYLTIGRVRGNDFTDREKYHGAFQVSDNADP